MKPAYPPREAIRARRSADMAPDVDDAAPTTLDRPLFLGSEDIGVPHTRDRSVSPLLSAEDPSRPVAGTQEPSEPAPPHEPRVGPPLWVIAVLAVVGGLVGGVFGVWVAS